MNNQAAQTIPELPARVFFAAPSEGYTADQMHQYARDYAAALSKTAGAPFGHAMFNAKGACVGFRQNHGFGYNFTVADFLRADEIMPDGAPHTGCLVYAAAPDASGGEYPECSGDPASCPENEGYGCCKPNPARHVAIVCDWKDADPFPRFIEAEIGGKSVSLEWRDRPDGLKELIVPVTDSAVRALEQTLTQRRGECEAVAEIREHVGGAMHGIPYAFILKRRAVKAGDKLYTTPQPGAEAMRELVQRWREDGSPYMDDCADKLESLLGRGGK